MLALLLAANMTCPIFSLPATRDRDAVCIDCNTQKEVPCSQPSRRKVTGKLYHTMIAQGRYGGDPYVAYNLYAEDETRREWTCRIDPLLFWKVELGDMYECPGGWKR